MFTDEQMASLRERNEARMTAVKEQLGEHWVLHPRNAPQKRPAKDVQQTTVLETYRHQRLQQAQV